MVMPDTARRYTVDEVLAFPDDGNRYELVRGELLVTPAPAPRHQVLVTQLTTRLSAYLEALGKPARVFAGPGDITWGSSDDWVQPDVFVVPRGEATNDWRDYRTLLLVVEVISPASARGDRLVKRRLYQERGAGTYWIVDADARLVEVWRPNDERPEIVTGTLRWHVRPDADQLAIDLAELFLDLPG
jgi:Uma2 family endonuclease